MKRSILIIAIIFFIENLHSQSQNIDTKDSASKLSPALYLPGIVSTGLNEFGCALTPPQDELYYCIRHRSDLFVILTSSFSNGSWSNPKIANFSGFYNDADPFISEDGKYLYFCSDRPINDEDTLRDWNIWRLERVGKNWGNIKLLEFNTPNKNEMYPTVSLNGNVYFHSDLLSPNKFVDFNRTDLYYSINNNGKYSGYEKLPICSNDFPEWDPFISPKEDYLIFTTTIPGGFGGGDMYISFRSINGNWSKPLNMGSEVNSNGMDYCPNLTPDKKHLIFSSYRNNIDFTETPLSYERIKELLNRPQNGNGDVYTIDSSLIIKLKQ